MFFFLIYQKERKIEGVPKSVIREFIGDLVLIWNCKKVDLCFNLSSICLLSAGWAQLINAFPMEQLKKFYPPL